MKKYVMGWTMLFGIVVGVHAHAQMMQDMMRESGLRSHWNNEAEEHDFREYREGSQLWEHLREKKIACADLNDEEFSALGGFFLGQMIGDMHASMRTLMFQMHGTNKEDQIIVGKRFSGCDISSPLPAILSMPMHRGGWMPMHRGGWMPMMRGERHFPHDVYPGHFGAMPVIGWVLMIAMWILAIVGAFVVVKWIIGRFRGTRHTQNSARDILARRYAKGEIDRKEFEEKKKVLG